MSPIDIRQSPSETASRRWYAFSTKKAEALDNMSKQDVWLESWRWCSAWFMDHTAAIAPAVDSMARLIEYVHGVRQERCPHCGMDL